MTTNPFDADRPPEPPRSGRRRRGGSGRRRDESVLVPDIEFDSYYGRPVVKPAPWEADIPAYIFLGGLAAGSGLLGAGAHARGLKTLRRNSRYAALAAVAAGGLALVRDLGKPSRALNMMRTVKLTSPMSVGSWILSAFGAFAGLAVATEVVRPHLDDDSALGAVAEARRRGRGRRVGRVRGAAGLVHRGAPRRHRDAHVARVVQGAAVRLRLLRQRRGRRSGAGDVPDVADPAGAGARGARGRRRARRHRAHGAHDARGRRPSRSGRAAPAR